VDKREFFLNLDETSVSSVLQKQKAERQGSFFLSYRWVSRGLEYCIKIPKPAFFTKMHSAEKIEKYLALLNQVGRDPFPYLPPMVTGKDATFRFWLVMPWGEAAQPPADIMKTLVHLEESYHITLKDILQCHQCEKMVFISDWSDMA
jgi:hypothetical protein